MFCCNISQDILLHYWALLHYMRDGAHFITFSGNDYIIGCYTTNEDTVYQSFQSTQLRILPQHRMSSRL